MLSGTANNQSLFCLPSGKTSLQALGTDNNEIHVGLIKIAYSAYVAIRRKVIKAAGIHCQLNNYHNLQPGEFLHMAVTISVV